MKKTKKRHAELDSASYSRELKIVLVSDLKSASKNTSTGSV